jgi:hypothetical protein
MSLTLIETKTLVSAQASIEFTSIPQDGTDLYILCSVREATTNDSVILLRFNSDTGSNYSIRNLQGTGSSVSSGGGTTTFLDIIGEGSSQTANTFGNASIYVPNYTSNTAKSVSADSVEENNATAALMRITAGLYSGTAAITTVTLSPFSGNWAIGTTASLYKITKGSDGIVTTS